jgi:hypothetical protein
MNLSIRIDDGDVRDLINRTPAKLDDAMLGGMNDATALLVRELKTYPSPPAGSTYKRTRALSNSWHKEIEGRGLQIRGIVGSNQNIAPHNRVVQDEVMQAQIHRGRWQTAQDVLQRNETNIRGMFSARVRAALG